MNENGRTPHTDNAERWLTAALLVGTMPDDSAVADHIGEVDACDFAGHGLRSIVQEAIADIEARKTEEHARKRTKAR